MIEIVISYKKKTTTTLKNTVYSFTPQFEIISFIFINWNSYVKCWVIEQSHLGERSPPPPILQYILKSDAILRFSLHMCVFNWMFEQKMSVTEFYSYKMN